MLFYTSLFILIFIKTSLAYLPQGCTPKGNFKAGFNIKAYDYKQNDNINIFRPQYLAYEYAQQKLLDSTSGITNINLHYYGSSTNSDTVFGMKKLHGGNICFEFKTYFRAPTTGKYKLTLENVDDSAAIYFGGGLGFDCCAEDEPPLLTTDATLSTARPGPTSENGNADVFIDLEEGVYYPLRIVYINIVAHADFIFSMTLPDGTVIKDFKNYAYSIPSSEQTECTVPIPDFSNTTTTIPWTGTYTTLYSTYTTYYIGSDGITTPERIYYIQTPGPTLYSTSTTSWSRTYTITYSTFTTYQIGSDGYTYPEEIYYVKTPIVISTSYSSSSSIFSPIVSSSSQSSSISKSYSTISPTSKSSSMASISSSLSSSVISSSSSVILSSSIVSSSSSPVSSSSSIYFSSSSVLSSSNALSSSSSRHSSSSSPASSSSSRESSSNFVQPSSSSIISSSSVMSSSSAKSLSNLIQSSSSSIQSSPIISSTSSILSESFMVSSTISSTFSSASSSIMQSSLISSEISSSSDIYSSSSLSISTILSSFPVSISSLAPSTIKSSSSIILSTTSKSTVISHLSSSLDSITSKTVSTSSISSISSSICPTCLGTSSVLTTSISSNKVSSTYPTDTPTSEDPPTTYPTEIPTSNSVCPTCITTLNPPNTDSTFTDISITTTAFITHSTIQASSSLSRPTYWNSSIPMMSSRTHTLTNTPITSNGDVPTPDISSETKQGPPDNSPTSRTDYYPTVPTSNPDNHIESSTFSKLHDDSNSKEYTSISTYSSTQVSTVISDVPNFDKISTISVRPESPEHKHSTIAPDFKYGKSDTFTTTTQRDQGTYNPEIPNNPVITTTVTTDKNYLSNEYIQNTNSEMIISKDEIINSNVIQLPSSPFHGNAPHSLSSPDEKTAHITAFFEGSGSKINFSGSWKIICLLLFFI